MYRERVPKLNKTSSLDFIKSPAQYMEEEDELQKDIYNIFLF